VVLIIKTIKCFLKRTCSTRYNKSNCWIQQNGLRGFKLQGWKQWLSSRWVLKLVPMVTVSIKPIYRG
jgi:hypothetical protein